MSATRRRVVVRTTDMKTCQCGALFPLEFNRRGLITSRQLCERCREKHHKALPDTAGIPRFVASTALVGEAWGSVTHLDANGRCLACATWHTRLIARQLASLDAHMSPLGLTRSPSSAL